MNRYIISTLCIMSILANGYFVFYSIYIGAVFGAVICALASVLSAVQLYRSLDWD